MSEAFTQSQVNEEAQKLEKLTRHALENPEISQIARTNLVDELNSLHKDNTDFISAVDRTMSLYWVLFHHRYPSLPDVSISFPAGNGSLYTEDNKELVLSANSASRDMPLHERILTANSEYTDQNGVTHAGDVQIKPAQQLRP